MRIRAENHLMSLTCSLGCFFRNIQDMAADRSVMLIDLPGFAESDRPEFGPNPEMDWLKSLQSVLSQEVKEKYWLAGHSFGGFLAARLAMEEGERLEGVILMDPWGFKVSYKNFYIAKYLSYKLFIECSLNES